MADSKQFVAILGERSADIQSQWLGFQQQNLSLRNNLLKPGELEEQSRSFLDVLLRTMSEAPEADVATSVAWSGVRDTVANIARSRARQGFSPSETAMFIFSLKQPIFAVLRRELPTEAQPDAMWRITLMLDALGLQAIETYQIGREEIINRQQQELLELSTPVVELWEGVLALPLIGTLDSARTQVVMESLLQAIVTTGSSIAIIDITGVPVVDTLVAQHLLKTVAAARLMGADCIISGIRPQIAQTIVHLGVEISDVMTKATLADAFAVALTRIGLRVGRIRPAAAVE